MPVILAFISNLFGAIDRLFAYLAQQRLVQAGRDELAAEINTTALLENQHAEAIDARPAATDPADVLSRL